jgi:GDP-L-fucose synthase
MEKDAKIFVAAHEAMVGAALADRLAAAGFANLLTRTASQLDLTDQHRVAEYFHDVRPAYVFLPSVKVGGIMANAACPADFIYENLQAQTNVIHAAWQSGVKKLLFLGSSCIYPKDCPQPMKEEYLLSGKLEPTSEPYAIAKIAGIRMCQAYNRQYGTEFLAAVPADVYGPHDDFDPETGHVLAALLGKIHRAKAQNQPRVAVWGTGSPRREALYVDDLAEACIFLMDHYDDSRLINIGSGQDVSIKDLAVTIRDTVGFRGEIAFDTSKPDGMPRKLLDNRNIEKLGWSPKTGLDDGLRRTYRWYQQHNTMPAEKN